MSREHHDPEKARQLDHLYEHVPVVKCKGLCTDSCGPVVQHQSMTGQELLRLQDTGGLRSGRMRRRPDVCPYLNAEGRCDVYEVRPLICRLWGVTDHPLMRCPHGCEVEVILSDPQAKMLMARAQVIGGVPPDSLVYGTGRHHNPDVLSKVRLEIREDSE